MTMFHAIRTRINATTVLAGLALVFAMTGGAYAAKKYLITSTKQISPSVLKSLQGKAGAAGAPGAAGAQGAQGPAGPAGPAGAAGAKGETGPAGAKGEKGATGNAGNAGPTGATGATGATGFTETLPSGKTETGDWNVTIVGAVSGGTPGAVGSISFPIPLASHGAAGESFVFNKEQTENKEFGSSGCSGSVEAPAAPPGKLCVYTKGEQMENVSGTLFAVEPGFTGSFGKSGAVLVGLHLEGKIELVGESKPELVVEPAKAVLDGSWAVTAPRVTAPSP
jgi:hypothetical protein